MKHLALLATLALGAAPPSDQARFVAYPLVHRVSCEGGRLTGTAFRIGPDKFATVAHVAANIGCQIDGKPVHIEAIQGQLDFAEVRSGKRKGGKFEIDCGGFIPGRWYYAVGYALGLPIQTLTPVYALPVMHNSGERMFTGAQFIHGMSGGPVFGEDGRVVGTVNALIPGSPYSLSRELKDTVLCR